MKLRGIFLMLCAVAGLTAIAVDPMATKYTFGQCNGSLMPYPTEIGTLQYPDSLVPVFINHVGRHGSRFPASATNCLALKRALAYADSIGTITQLGRDLMKLTDFVISTSADRWGSLDSLGMAEQRAIATRMFYKYTDVFTKGPVNAISSYSPRSMMSMYSFTHQLDRLDNHIEVTTSTGRTHSSLLRPFDTDADYLEFRKNNVWRPAYDQYFASVCPTTAIQRVLGEDFPLESQADARDIAIIEYYVIAGLPAMGLSVDVSTYFTIEEYNALWSCFNLRQYLQRTASTVSTVPADIASDLLLNIIETTDNYINGTGGAATVNLRFGHAETLMPLLSLLRLPGCYYLTNYFDTVGLHWRDFDVVPMSANLQLILFKERKSGRHYLRVDLNEQPCELIPNCEDIYVLWDDARDYMMRCIPIYAQ